MKGVGAEQGTRCRVWASPGSSFPSQRCQEQRTKQCQPQTFQQALVLGWKDGKERCLGCLVRRVRWRRQRCGEGRKETSGEKLVPWGWQLYEDLPNKRHLSSGMPGWHLSLHPFNTPQSRLGGKPCAGPWRHG